MNPLWACLILVMLSLAGCAGARPAEDAAGPESVEPLAPPQFNDDEGAVVGRAVDDEQVPVANASLRLVGGSKGSAAALLPLPVGGSVDMTTLSASDGRFQFDHLPPGLYSLIGQTDRHQPVARGVEVSAGRVTNIVLTFAAVPPPFVPYMKQVADWNGYLGCSLGLYAVTLQDSCGPIDSKVNSSGKLVFSKHLNAVHWEMHWRASAAFSARFMDLLFTSPALFNCSKWGPSPVVRDCILGGNATTNPWWEKDSTTALPQVRAKGNNTVPNANTLGAWANEQSGPVIQQRFTVYWTLFHGGMEIPPGFRNSPDR